MPLINILHRLYTLATMQELLPENDLFYPTETYITHFPEEAPFSKAPVLARR